MLTTPTLSESDTPFDPQKLDHLAWRIFTKRHGLTLPVDTINFLRSRLYPDLRQADVISSLNQMAIEFKSRPGVTTSTLVTVELLQQVLENSRRWQGGHLTDNNIEARRNFVQVSSGEKCLKWEWDSIERRFIASIPDHLGQLASIAYCKVEMFRRRYEITKQRVLAHLKSIDNEINLASVKSVKGQHLNELQRLFGFITERPEGGGMTMVLEDSDDQIKLDFSQLKQDSPQIDSQMINNKNILPTNQAPFLTEDSLVLVEGLADGFQFRVLKLIPPPLDTSNTPAIRNHLIDLPIKLNVARHLESQHLDSSLMVLSDLYLDCPQVMNRFVTLLEQLSKDTKPFPLSIVLQGPYLSRPPPLHLPILKHLTTLLSNLANILSRFPNLRKQCRFLLQPGPSDPLQVPWWPTIPWPTDSNLLESFRQQDIDIEILANPARLFFFDREIVVVRGEMTSWLWNHGLKELDCPFENVDTFKLLLEQGYCAPLPVEILPRAWNLDHVLDLFPPPDVLVVSECSIGRDQMVTNCLCVNAGSFAMANSSFALIYPLLNRVEWR